MRLILVSVEENKRIEAVFCAVLKHMIVSHLPERFFTGSRLWASVYLANGSRFRNIICKNYVSFVGDLHLHSFTQTI